jgi:hypothetical protein
MDEADRECRVDEALRLLERALALVDGVNEDAAMHVQIAIDRLMPQPRQSQVAPDDWDLISLLPHLTSRVYCLHRHNGLTVGTVATRLGLSLDEVVKQIRCAEAFLTGHAIQ